MSVLDALERTGLTIVVVPVGFILVDAAFRALGAREANPLVRFVRAGSDLAVPQVATTMFTDQPFWQTTLIAVLMYGVVAIALLLLFRGIRSVVAGAKT